MTVQADQIYASCKPGTDRRIRVIVYPEGAERAVIEDISGLRIRRIDVTSLHPTRYRADGKPWRTGYYLQDPT